MGASANLGINNYLFDSGLPERDFFQSCGSTWICLTLVGLRSLVGKSATKRIAASWALGRLTRRLVLVSGLNRTHPIFWEPQERNRETYDGKYLGLEHGSLEGFRMQFCGSEDGIEAAKLTCKPCLILSKAEHRSCSD